MIDTSECVRGEEAVLQWPYTPSSEKTVNDFFFSCFDLSTLFQMEKEMICAVYSGFLERKMENINAHGPKKYT